MNLTALVQQLAEMVKRSVLYRIIMIQENGIQFALWLHSVVYSRSISFVKKHQGKKFLRLSARLLREPDILGEKFVSGDEICILLYETETKHQCQ